MLHCIQLCYFVRSFSRNNRCVSFMPVFYGQYGSGSKASFTPFVDPRVYQTSPTEENSENSAAGS